jgi:hypothetical protein
MLRPEDQRYDRGMVWAAAAGVLLLLLFVAILGSAVISALNLV